MRLFGSRRRATPVVQPQPAPKPSPRAAPRPWRPIVSDLSEQDTVELYNLATVRKLASSDPLLPEGEEIDAVHLVTDGFLELAFDSGSPAGLGVKIGPGDCVATSKSQGGAGGSSSACTLKAAGPCTVMSIGPLVWNQLSPSVQSALFWKLSTGSTARLNGIAMRHADALRKTDCLVSHVAAMEERTQRILTSPEFQTIIRGIPRLPFHATDLLSKLLDDRLNANEAVESIKDNPALAGMVLKTVNSAYYGLRSKVGDYYHAFLLLGVNAVYQIILSNGIQSSMPEAAEDQESQTRAFIISLMTHELAVLSRTAHPQTMTTIGLLHEIGRSAGKVLQRKRPDLGPILEEFGQARVGATLLASWELPDRIVEVVRLQNHPEFTPPDLLATEFKSEVAILHVARLCHDIAVQKEGQRTPSPFAKEYLAALRLEATDVEDLYSNTLYRSIVKQCDNLPAPVRAYFERGSEEAAAA